MSVADRAVQCVVVAVVAGAAWGLFSGTIAWSSGDGEGDAGETSSEDGTEGNESADPDSGEAEREAVEPSMRRSPAQIQRAPLALSTDLKPIKDDLAKKYLEEICPDPPVRISLENRDGEVWSCGSCPGFTSLAESEGPLVLEKFIRGSFIEEGHREAFVTYRGCEPKNAAYGGAVIFRKMSGEWEPFYRHPGLHPQGCLKFSRQGHADRLACRLRYESRGRVIEKVVDAATRRGAVRLVRSLDNSIRCSKRKFISSYLVGWERADVNSDGRDDLVVHKVQRHEPLGKDNDREVCALEDSDGTWDRARKIIVELRFSGKRFHMHNRRFEPLPASAREAANYADRGADGSSGEAGEEAAGSEQGAGRAPTRGGRSDGADTAEGSE